MAHTRLLRRLPVQQRSCPRRGFINFPPESSVPVIGAIMGTNLAVFGAWKWAEKEGWKEYRFMQDNFTVCRAGLMSRPHTLITASFSHSDGYHLLGNMVRGSGRSWLEASFAGSRLGKIKVTPPLPVPRRSLYFFLGRRASQPSVPGPLPLCI